MIENKNLEMSCSGFTLIELLVGIIVGLIFFTAVGAFYVDQTKSHEDHQMIVEMGQNGRAALALITNDLMLAGYAPKRITTGETATVKEALINKLHVTYDANDDGIIDLNPADVNNTYNEQTIYEFVLDTSSAGTHEFKRNDEDLFPPGIVTYASFAYAYDTDNMGDSGYGVLEGQLGTVWGYCDAGSNLLTNGYIVDDQSGVIFGYPVDRAPVNRIRAVKVWIVLRSHKRKNKQSVDPPMGIIPIGNDSIVNLDDTDSNRLDADYAYRLFTTTVKLRNMYY